MELVYRFDELNKTAETVLKNARNHSVWAFYGDMGAGKTTLIHELCKLMNVSGSFGSPTFSIINEYESPKGPVYHIDLYRCRDEDEAVRAGVEDCLYSGHLCMVEWPGRAEGIFPEGTLRLTLTVIDEFTRQLSVETSS